MSTALGNRVVTELHKVSKATTQMDRRIVHARQLFNEGLERLQTEYHERMRRAVLPETEEPPAAVSVAS